MSSVTNVPMFAGWRVTLALWPLRLWWRASRPRTTLEAMARTLEVASYTRTWVLGPLEVVQWVNLGSRR